VSLSPGNYPTKYRSQITLFLSHNNNASHSTIATAYKGVLYVFFLFFFDLKCNNYLTNYPVDEVDNLQFVIKSYINYKQVYGSLMNHQIALSGSYDQLESHDSKQEGYDLKTHRPVFSQHSFNIYGSHFGQPSALQSSLYPEWQYTYGSEHPSAPQSSLYPEWQYTYESEQPSAPQSSLSLESQSGQPSAPQSSLYPEWQYTYGSEQPSAPQSSLSAGSQCTEPLLDDHRPRNPSQPISETDIKSQESYNKETAPALYGFPEVKEFNRLVEK
jgi:hypothetical protein